VAYPATQLKATGGTPPYTWSDVNNTLQTYGLTLDATTGEITGTPNQATSSGGVTITIEVTDANNKTAQADFTLVIYPELRITTTSLPDGYEGQTGYSATLTATGGTGTYTWSLTGGNLPANLSWDAATATISGDIASNASASSPYNISVEVTDGMQTVTANLTLTVYAQLQITTTALPDGYDGQVGYSVTLAATGGTGTYTWRMTSGRLPLNLRWDAATATISGDIASNASANSPYNISIEVTDGQQTVQANFSITVWQQLQITTTSLDDATEGVAYSYTVTASGGNSSSYNWSVSGQPSWLSIDASTGELSGTPPTGSAGTCTFTVEVTDGVQTASKQFDLAVLTPAPARADFEASPTYGTAPLTVTFTDKSTGTITQWEWDFDNDGTVDSTQQNPTWTYSTAGWYTVTLEVTGPRGTDTCVKKMYVLVAKNLYYVDGANGDDANGGTGWNDAFATIWKALSVAGDYDLVLVADATYNETDLNFKGKKIYLKGVAHNTTGAQPVIGCQGKGRAFYFGSGETGNSVIDNFTIKNGSANYGGAICCENSSNPTLTYCTFTGNSTMQYGGAIHCDGSSPSIVNCIFVGNSAGGNGGAISCISNSNPSITNCAFSNGGANFSAAVYCDSSSPTITNCTFSGNSAYEGGAIGCVSNSSSHITNCIFSKNSANRVGAISCWDSTPTITNCIFSGNLAWRTGGAIGCNDSSNPTVTNCTFSGNRAGESGGAVYCYQSSATLNNSILWGNTASISGDEVWGQCTLNYCCVDSTGLSGNITENNCIHSDPKFACAEAGVLRLKHDSPCIDAGDSSLVPAGVTTDIMGCHRVVGSAVDIGAYEVQGIVYVDGISGDDANSGADWSNALKTIGAGLSAADDGWIVVVADTTYNETDLNSNGKKIYLEGVDYHSGGLTQPVIDCQQAGRAFYFGSGETSDSVVDNFTIQNGRVEDRGGGAVLCENDSSPTITNCVFQNNEAADTNSSSDNEHGGAVYCLSNSNLTMVKCEFSNNDAAQYGGAICCSSSSPTITNCTFSSNGAENGGAVGCISNSNPSIVSCAFSSNSADYGGALHCDFSGPYLTNCLLVGNSATNDGGAIYSDNGGWCAINCTFSGNSANNGGAVGCNNISGVTLVNSILWSNTASSSGNEIYINDSGSSSTLKYCCVDSTGYGFGSGVPTTTIDDSEHCIHGDPQFVNAANGDYHLKNTSPCIDVGSGFYFNQYAPFGVRTDLDGKERFADGSNNGSAAVDIGAYEYQP